LVSPTVRCTVKCKRSNS